MSGSYPKCAGRGWANYLSGGNGRVEPGPPITGLHHRDLSSVVRCNIRSGLGGQHREPLAQLRNVADNACDPDHPTIWVREEPPILALLLRVRGLRELVEAVREDQDPTVGNSRPSDRKLYTGLPPGPRQLHRRTTSS